MWLRLKLQNEYYNRPLLIHESTFYRTICYIYHVYHVKCSLLLDEMNLIDQSNSPTHNKKWIKTIHFSWIIKINDMITLLAISRSSLPFSYLTNWSPNGNLWTTLRCERSGHNTCYRSPPQTMRLLISVPKKNDDIIIKFSTIELQQTKKWKQWQTPTRPMAGNISV